MAQAPYTGRFDDIYGRLVREFADQIGERAPAYTDAGTNVREEIVRCIWFGGHFRPEGMTTDDGRRLEIHSPGWWNVEGGPDFLRAEFLLEGAGRVTGDVEVHTAASAWYGHGHHRQPEYNDVALHVVMWNDRHEPCVRAQNGAAIPQLTLSRAVDDDLEELVDVIDPDDEPTEPVWHAVEGKYCGQAYARGEIDPQWLGRMLDIAGDHRMLKRAETVGELLANHSPDQLLYERVAEALGYKSNRMPFLQLAGLLPVDALRRAVPPGAAPSEKRELLGAALLVTAGFLADGAPEECDAETDAYVENLRRAEQRLGGPLAPTSLQVEQWSFGGTRPVNYPQRRIAALACLCAEHLHTGLFAHFLRTVNSARPQGREREETAVRKALTQSFLHLRDPYWSFRYTLGGKRLATERALVGEERATSIVVDVLLPLLLAHARAEDDAALTARLHALWRGLPRRQDNAVTRRMQLAMFPESSDARSVVKSARRQQGLHQLHGDFCRRDVGCERCVIYLARQAGKPLHVS